MSAETERFKEASDALNAAILRVAQAARSVADDAEPQSGGGYVVSTEEMECLRDALKAWTWAGDRILKEMHRISVDAGERLEKAKASDGS